MKNKFLVFTILFVLFVGCGSPPDDEQGEEYGELVLTVKLPSSLENNKFIKFIVVKIEHPEYGFQKTHCELDLKLNGCEVKLKVREGNHELWIGGITGNGFFMDENYPIYAKKLFLNLSKNQTTRETVVLEFQSIQYFIFKTNTTIEGFINNSGKTATLYEEKNEHIGILRSKFDCLNTDFGYIPKCNNEYFVNQGILYIATTLSIGKEYKFLYLKIDPHLYSTSSEIVRHSDMLKNGLIELKIY